MGTHDDNCSLSPDLITSLCKQIVQATTAYREFHAEFEHAMLAVRERCVAFSEQLQQAFAAIAQIDWSEVDRKATQDLVRLAELGWTVAPWMTLRQVARLANLDSNALDQEFLTFYFEEGALEKTKRTLIDGAHMEPWKPLLKQIFSAIDRKEHLIAIPALLLMLEGFVVQFAESTNSKLVCSTNVPNMVNAVRATHDQYKITGRLWASTTAFLSQLYKRAPFSEQRPSFVNRHWILHGRDAMEWSAADALRVLNALSTLHWLMCFEEWARTR